MKYRYTLLLVLAGLLISSYSMAQGSLAALESKNGFRDVKFGTSIKNYSGMYQTKDNKLFDDAHFILYRRKSDRLKLGNIPLESIEYLVKDGRIYRVEIFLYSTNNLIKTENALRFAYGKPTQTYPYQSNWEGKKVLMMYTQTKNYEGRPLGILQIYSSPMFYEDTNKENMKKSQEMKQAASDL